MFALREIKLAESKVGRYRMSTTAHWFWCAEQAYWQARGIYAGAKRQKEVGTQIHKERKEEVKRWIWETSFLEKLDKFRQDKYGFVRRLGKDHVFFDVSGHPDEFQVTKAKKVSIIEINTTEISEKQLDFYIRYRLPIKQFQCQGYCFILEPYIKEIGYELDKIHAVELWHVKYRQEKGMRVLVKREPLASFPVFYYPVQFETELLRVLEGLQDHDMVIPPRGAPNCFKCKQCPKVYKEHCQFWRKT